MATLGPAGYVPLAPGTVGSALTALVLGVVPVSRPALAGCFVAVTVLGLWAAHRAERILGRKDPGAVVIDEVAGMILSVLALPLTPAVVIFGLVLFRLFDILKPFPARLSQRLPGGPGIIVDDLIAGLYALGAQVAARSLVRWL